MTEPIPDNCLPPPATIRDLLHGPELDASGRIKGDGCWAGMTPAEVLADRDAFNAAMESGAPLLRKLREARNDATQAT